MAKIIRYNRDSETNFIPKGEETIKEKFMYLEGIINAIKKELTNKNLSNRLNKIEAMFACVSTTMQIVIEDLQLLGSIRKSMKNEVTILQQCINANLVILSHKEKLIAKASSKFTSNNEKKRIRISHPYIGLNGSYWKTNNFERNRKMFIKIKKVRYLLYI